MKHTFPFLLELVNHPKTGRLEIGFWSELHQCYVVDPTRPVNAQADSDAVVEPDYYGLTAQERNTLMLANELVDKTANEAWRQGSTNIAQALGFKKDSADHFLAQDLWDYDSLRRIFAGYIVFEFVTRS